MPEVPHYQIGQFFEGYVPKDANGMGRMFQFEMGGGTPNQVLHLGKFINRLETGQLSIPPEQLNAQIIVLGNTGRAHFYFRHFPKNPKASGWYVQYPKIPGDPFSLEGDLPSFLVAGYENEQIGPTVSEFALGSIGSIKIGEKLEFFASTEDSDNISRRHLRSVNTVGNVVYVRGSIGIFPPIEQAS